MAYNPTQWIDGRTPVNALHLNKNERGIEQQGLDVEVLSEFVTDLDTRMTEDIKVVSDFVAELDTRVADDIKNVSDFVADLDTRVADDITNVEGSISILDNRVDNIDININQVFDSMKDLDGRITEMGDVDSVDVGYSTSADPNITSVKDALDKLLYVNLSINLSSNLATTLEKGYIANSISFTWSYNKSVISQAFDGVDLENTIRNYTYTTPLSNNKTFILTANDGKSSFTKSIAYSFVYPIYIGSLPANVVVPTQSDIINMEKRIASPSNQTMTYNIDNRKMCIAVPSNWTIRNIIDPNNFDITSSFVMNTVQITGLDGVVQNYKVYTSEPTSQSGFLIKFNI